MRERHLCRTFKLYKNSFCQLRAGLEVLKKVTSKADRWKQSGKSFTKNWFRIAFFSITKNVFCYLLAKFFLPNPDACDLPPAVSSFAAHGHELLVQHWHTQQACDVSWLFWVYLYLTIEYKIFQELRFRLSADSYLWSLQLDVNIVKAMFNSIFTACCKYIYSKTMLNSWSHLLRNCVKNFRSWIGLLLLQLVVLLSNYFCSVSWIKVRTDSTTIFDNISCTIFHTSAV